MASGDALTADATLAAGATTPPAAGMDAELKALRGKAGRICDELAALYRCMEQQQRKVEDHQQR